jgi:hypothetical protein
MGMGGLWLQDIESFERVSQDAYASRLVLRLAQLSREGRLGPFVTEMVASGELDEDTRAAITELSGDEGFLLAMEDYLGRTAVLH